MSKLQRKLLFCINISALVLFVWIVVLLFFLTDMNIFWIRKDFLMNNICLGCLGVSIIVSIIFLLEKCGRKNKRIDYDKMIFAASIIFFLLQFYIMCNIYFETGWDSGGVIVPAARALALNENKEILQDGYFSIYPNNLFLVSGYYFILRCNSVFGIFPGEYDLMSIVLVNCIISSIVAWRIYKIGVRVFGRKYAFIGWLFGICMLVFSPWNVICYSDPIALLFPVLIIDIYLCRRVKYYMKIFLSSMIGYIGYCIKPQTCICIIAIVCMELIKGLSELNLEKTKMIIGALGLSMGLVFLTADILEKVYEYEGFRIEDEQKLGSAHFLMMGMNEESGGIYSRDDVLFSVSFETKAERNKANIIEAGKRIQKMGAAGCIRHFSRKMLINYSDGTFAWGGEGTFYLVLKDDLNSRSAPLLKNIYYNTGAHFLIFSSLEQLLWITLIIFILWKIFRGVVIWRNAEDAMFYVLLLTIIGLTVFELIFEARARYLYSYVPIYIFAALYGMRDAEYIIKKIHNKSSRIK